ncbi:hypothetical protein A2819_03035 [Candidatus Azambacteria bacterium RIFCSPHIGHO2_01_FULL_40_24]|uniref:Uncharacterized protein n=1 Tax=Candidatus Azambacteria bacterium RIFCSPHIGHO2_01_FULL_40_24 TaxID=1797301 RepID=A0A1F5B2A6_9BACT|nr:MAG: hypothetical protein A2819_03035 [Candidatus Azambacteria bacterium RIFCSPHIGHO2_01_FULL_40_24]
MADPIPQKDENIIIRTMKGDLEYLKNPHPKKEEKPIPTIPAGPISQEAKASIVQTPASLPPIPKVLRPVSPVGGPPILVVPPKIIPPKEIAEIPTKPLFKATPVWLKISGIGLGIFLFILIGLYGYWKIFVQGQPITPTPPIATTTPPTLPTTPVATSTAPIKFFNKLPNKEITIEISSKTSAALLNALKSEAAMEETRASIKQVKITYQGKPITTEEFLNLMMIFAPQNFLPNYESEFALAYFSQKEGARPILILKAKKRSEMEIQMKDWEAKTLASDIFPLFLNSGQLPKISSSFKLYLFIGQPVRYLNINMPFASLNYAIYNDFLIFTTSSAGMFVILQDLTGQTVSQNYLENLKASINEFVR